MTHAMSGLFWTWIFSGPCIYFAASGKPPVLLPHITDRVFIKECVDAHNKARSAVNPRATDMLYMTWDAGLAVTARAWARRCEFNHNIYLQDVHRVHPVFSSVGENLWAVYPVNIFNVTHAVDFWVSEKRYYTYRDKSCSKICGHYTQVVWATSYKVGCAVQLCSNGVKYTSFAHEESSIFVCNYATAGNFEGQYPYQTGANPCSKCEGKCQKNLCSKPERDVQQSYSDWNPDWDPALSTCDTSCLALVTIRPLALLLTFIAAYGVHYLYPDIFCYE